MARPSLHRFRPRLLDALKGYARRRFVADVSAGITVGVVALPLAMAFAIASGVKPEQGLITAIVAGFLISATGGSDVQIGGPMPADFFAQAGALGTHRSPINPVALAIGLARTDARRRRSRAAHLLEPGPGATPGLRVR